MRHVILFSMTFLILLFYGSSSYAAQDVATQIISFKHIDSKATEVARKMYGRFYPFVEAERVWLEEPSEGYDQMIVRLGPNRRCKPHCMIVALYYSRDDAMWLEVWRGRGNHIGIGEIGIDGIRSIHDAGGRIWNWSSGNYRPSTLGKRPKPRPATEQEKKAVLSVLISACSSKTLECSKGDGKMPDGEEPPEYSAYDIPLKEGGETFIAVGSIYFCGNSACPLLLLDKDNHLISHLYAYAGDFAIKPERGKNNIPLVELFVADGIAVHDIGSDRQVDLIEAQPVRKAGRRKPE